MASIDPTSAGLAGRAGAGFATFPADAGVELSGPAGTHGCAAAPERAQAEVNKRMASKLFCMGAQHNAIDRGKDRDDRSSLLSCPA